jgi:hypothetical protein
MCYDDGGWVMVSDDHSESGCATRMVALLYNRVLLQCNPTLVNHGTIFCFCTKWIRPYSIIHVAHRGHFVFSSS